MKKMTLFLAVLLAFTLTAFAQESGASGGQESSQSTTTTTTKTHKRSAKGASGKTASITGCVSKDANSDGMYTLTNGHFKKGVEIGPTDKVQAHAGHQVKLTGHWASAAAVGEKDADANSSKEKKERHFEVDDVQHMADTCSATASGMAHHKKGAKAKTGTGL